MADEGNHSIGPKRYYSPPALEEGVVIKVMFE